MSRPGITKADVARAVQKLHETGHPTTTRVVRIELGRGSHGTISQFLKELQAKSAARPAQLPELPDDIQRKFADAVYGVWEASTGHAVKRVTEVQAQCEQRIRTLSADLTRERQLRERLEAELSSASTDLASCKHRAHLLEEELSMLRTELRIQKELQRRAERDRDLMLRKLGSAAQVTPRRQKR